LHRFGWKSWQAAPPLAHKAPCDPPLADSEEGSHQRWFKPPHAGNIASPVANRAPRVAAVRAPQGNRMWLIRLHV